MIQIYADGVLAYDSRLRERGKDYSLLGLTTTTGLNKGGTAEITMPPGHPAFSQFVSHRTIVELFRDKELRFRGRVLYPIDDFYNRRTWTCEGEMCLLQDGTSRPYLYQADPETVFRSVIDTYNTQVESFKRFRVGTVTVTDPNDYIRIESENAESSLDTVKKLISRCGGYITFSTAADGAREINWLSELGHRCEQQVAFGYNLLDFTRTGANTDLATVIIPYGAKDSATGHRIDITSVNNGLDYIQDDEAVALRGSIVKAVVWDDVTDPVNLLRKAEQTLDERKRIITSLQLTALDLSYFATTPAGGRYSDSRAVVGDAVVGLAVVGTEQPQSIIDSFCEGDIIRVVSKPHAVDEDFQLTDKTEDWLKPGNSTITLGKTVATLTDASVAGDKKSQSELHQLRQEVKVDYQRDIADAIEQSEVRTQSLIEQHSDSIYAEVSKQQTDITGVKQQISAVEQTAGQLAIQVQSIQNNGVTEVKTTTGYTFGKDGLRIRKDGEQIENLLDHTGMSVRRSGALILRANNDGVEAVDVTVRNYLMLGSHARFEDYNDGADNRRTACFWRGG